MAQGWMARENRLVADAMLGRLAKWLRVMGDDTHYQPSYREGTLTLLIREGRILLSRNRKTVSRHSGAAHLIRAHHVGRQLREVAAFLPLAESGPGWFSRCLICNVPLQTPPPHVVREDVPDYVQHANAAAMRYCPSCNRCYWPGTHRHQMKKQLKAWGF